ncbi:MAG: Ig-like domain-containing protein [Gemmatimonadota bacterium]
MKLRRSTLLLLVAFACSRNEPVAPTGVPTVTMTYPASFLLVGDTIQLGATVFDENAQIVPGASVSWSSSNQAVATVGNDGRLVGRAPGEAVVTVTHQGSTSRATFTVDPDPCTGDLALAVGEVRQIRGARAFTCVNLAATAAAQELLYIVGNARAVQDDTLAYEISVPGPAAVALDAPRPRAFDPREVAARRDAEYVSAIEERLRGYERRVISDALDQVRANRAREISGAASLSVQSALLAEGDTVNIRVPNLQIGKNICRDFVPVRGVVRAVSSRATIVEDLTQPTGALSISDYRAIALEFDNLIFPVDTLWFGAPTDLNSDNRITIFYTPEVNKLTPAGSASIVGGFFFGGDLLRRTDYPATNDCRNQTNEQEIFYMLAPDPTGTVNGNARTTAGVRQVTRGTIAHEFQHMINQSVRQYNPAVKAFETAWLNEALSHFAEEAVGRAIRSFGDFQELNFAMINPSTTNQDDYLAFFRQNLTRFRQWQQRPDTSSPTSAKARDGLGARGAAWTLVRHAADHYSNGNARAFFRRLAAGPETDIPNLLARVGNRPFDEVIGGWLVANYADGLGIPGLNSRYTYPSWVMRDVMSAINNGPYPLLVTNLPGTHSSRVFSGSGNYYLHRRVAATPRQTITLRGAGGSTMSSPNARLWVLRIG